MLSSNQTGRSALADPPTENAVSIAEWLCLAAAPTFAIMAIVTMASGGADMICSATQGAFPMDGMTAMYLLMCAFHLPPWLRLISGRAVGATQP
ncbi:hypothetical protein ATY81_14555 [Rhizobium sp. R72]|uniref:hypothetical protein n=1 Tax=unclassified Rhizobium TaxID=2613769 RepID=UPI000B52D67A|nr:MULTISPECIES: hypothetical protein [unclassified Rhizobium]OWV82727.1 hypothetical protein ATY79_15145 [Rhizobium sp. R693]OWV93833.1 hypothetical protein ATY81_14555 [Rhizobium sp. R72]OWV94071.1 hypothetical protein ATY80_14555 [Rhizobium sp. R711]